MTRRPRRALSLTAVLTALVAAGALVLLGPGCGDDEEDSRATGATGPAAVADQGAAALTVEEFIAELRPEKERILASVVAGSDACRGVKVDGSFVLLVTSAGLAADPDLPLAELVEEQC